MSEFLERSCPTCGGVCFFADDHPGNRGSCGHCGAEFSFGKVATAIPVAAPLPKVVARPAAPPEPPPKPKLTRREKEDRLLDSIARWLEGREFMVEGKWKNATNKTEVYAGKAAVFAAKQLVKAMAGALPGMKYVGGVSGGASGVAVAEAMEPFFEMSDLVGVQFARLFSMSSANRIVPVLLADDVPPREITSLFERMMEAAKPAAELGMKTNRQRLPITVIPLVVYTDSRAYEEDAAKVLKKGSDRWFWGKVYLHAAAIDVPFQRIIWAEFPGWKLFDGTPWISERDLRDMLPR